VDREERVVVLVTGNGLKDVASARKAVGEPYIIEPTMDSLQQLIGRPGGAFAPSG